MKRLQPLQPWESIAGGTTPERVPVRQRRRRSERIRSNESLYQTMLPPEMQQEIMRHLAQNPAEAIRMAASSRTQRAALAGMPASELIRTSGMAPLPVVGRRSGYDYVRAMGLLGAGSGIRADTTLAQAQCLMEAFLRYVFTRRSAGFARNVPRIPGPSLRRWGRRPFGGASAPPLSMEQSMRLEQPSGDFIDFMDLPVARRAGGQIDPALVRDWYLWTTAPTEDAYEAESSPSSPLYAAWMSQTQGTGHMTSRGSAFLDDAVSRGDFIRVGPPGDESSQAVDVGRLQPITVISVDGLADLLGVPYDQVGFLFRMLRDITIHGSDGQLDELLGSPEARERLYDYIDRGIANNQRGTCGEAEVTGGFALPRFTSMFDLDLYLIPNLTEYIDVVGSVRSPRIEQTLTSVGAWPPPPSLFAALPALVD
nr:hypothetical protein [Pandoravirus massiliensis]